MVDDNIQELIKLKIRLHKERKYLDNVEIDDFTYGNPTILSWNEGTKLKIGKFCSIADQVTIFLGGEHRSDWVSTYPFNALLKNYSYIKGHPQSKGDVVIGNDVWIGRGAVIMSGINIGDGAIIGANSLVSKDVAPYSIFAGNPGKHIKYRFNSEIVNKMLVIKWWDKELEEIAEIIPLLQSNNIHEIIERYDNKRPSCFKKVLNKFK